MRRARVAHLAPKHAGVLELGETLRERRRRDRAERLAELREACAPVVRGVQDRHGVAPLEDVRRAADVLGNRAPRAYTETLGCTDFSSSARPSTSSIDITGWKAISSRTFCGMSSRSARFRSGMIDVGDPGRVSREHLLLETADRQDAALQRDLAGHADRVLHRSVR